MNGMKFAPKPPISIDTITALNRDLIKEYGREAQIDGIIDLEKYNAANPRILWILKEANWGEGYSGSEEGHDDITEVELEETLKIQIKAFNYYYNKITLYPKWKATFMNICYISHGILDKVRCWDWMDDIDSSAKIGGNYILGNIAFINVKKHPGRNRANSSTIAGSYTKHKEFLLRQINAINPDIIFDGSGVANLFRDLSGASVINRSSGFLSAKKSDRIIVKTYHPAQTTITQQSYVDLNLQAVYAAHAKG